MKRLASLSLLWITIAVTGCERAAEPDPATPRPAPGRTPTDVPVETPTGTPTLNELRNATYTGLRLSTMPVTLTSGLWQSPGEGVEAGQVTVHLMRDFLVTGDLDGDGTEEAVVLVAERGGDAGNFIHLAVVRRIDDGLRNVATLLLGDRVELRSGRISDGRLLLDVVQAGSDDAACCPGELATRPFRLVDGALVEAAPEQVGRLSLATLAGPRWVLRQWDLREPLEDTTAAPAFRVSGDRLEGFTGCNAFTATTVAGDLPGDLSITEIVTGETACSEAIQAVEQRFTEQLVTASRYRFLNGRLGLVYQGGGALRIMVFEAQSP